MRFADTFIFGNTFLIAQQYLSTKKCPKEISGHFFDYKRIVRIFQI